MQAAGDGVLTDQRTVNAAMGKWNFTGCGSIQLKGIADQVPLFRPGGKRREQPGRHASQESRSAERRTLNEYLHRLRQRQGATLLLLGEPGIGKSWLVKVLLDEARSLGITTFMGSGDAVEKSTPYRAWRSVFTQYFGLEAITDQQIKRDVVAQQLDRHQELADLAPLLNQVLALSIPETEVSSLLTGQLRIDNMHRLLLSLLQDRADATPLLIILEDAHWLDSASWRFALQVVQHVQPVLLVVVSRPPEEYARPEYAELLEHAKKLILQPLPDRELGALVARKLEASSLSAELAAIIGERAGGNPLFAEEIGRMFLDRGCLQRDGGRFELKPGAAGSAPLEIPTTVQGAVTSRIDRLPPPVQLVLKTASVIGRTFSPEMLLGALAAGSEPGQIAQHLHALERLDLLQRVSPETESLYAFKHVILQQVTYELMLFSQRRKLHRAIAEWQEVNFGSDIHLHYPSLAHHWGHAGDKSKKLIYLERSAEQAMATGAFVEAVKFYDMLLHDAKEPDKPIPMQRIAEWNRQVGEAYWSLGNQEQSRYFLERAVAQSGCPVPQGAWSLSTGIARELLGQCVHRFRKKRSGATTEAGLRMARAY